VSTANLSNVEAERELLGALLRDFKRVSEIVNRGVRADDFSDRILAALFSALVDLSERWCELPDSFSAVHEALRARGVRVGLAEAINLLTFLSTLGNGSAFVLHHADIVIERARRRRVGDVLRRDLALIEDAAPLTGGVAEIVAGTVDDIEAIVGPVAQVGRGGLILERMDTIAPEPIRWLWPERIPLAKVTVIAGDPKLGKSTVGLDIVARLSRGGPWPEALDFRHEQAASIILSAEDDPADTIRPRLDAAGADVSRVHVLRAVRDRADGLERIFSLVRDLPHLEHALREMRDVRLVLIDPATAYLDGTESHKNADVRALLAPLATLAAEHSVAVLLVLHLNKNGNGGPALYRISGSLAFAAAARSVLFVSKDPENPSRRFLLPGGSNLGSDVGGLAFTLGRAEGALAPAVLWERGAVRQDLDDLLEAQSGGAEARERRSARAEAERFLREKLADGPVDAKEIVRDASAAGVAKRTLDRAKADLGVTSRAPPFKGGPWAWELPHREIVNAPQAAGLGNLGNLGNLPQEIPARADARPSGDGRLPDCQGCQATESADESGTMERSQSMATKSDLGPEPCRCGERRQWRLDPGAPWTCSRCQPPATGLDGLEWFPQCGTAA
jgi:hypothetical protein